MTRYFVLFGVCLYISATCFAQTDLVKYNKLKSEAAASAPDTNQVLRYILLSQMNEDTRLDSALFFALKAEALAKKLNYPNKIFDALYQKANVYDRNKNNYALAINNYNKAADFALEHRLYRGLFVTYGSILNTLYYLADYPAAMETAQKGLAMAKQLNDKITEAQFINQLGFIYIKQQKPDEASKYYERYLSLSIQAGNKLAQADADNCFADVFLLKKDWQNALKFAFSALSIYDKMNPIGAQRLDRTRTVAKQDRVDYTLFKISSIYKQSGDYKQALRYALLTVKNKTINGVGYNAYDLSSYYTNLGDIYSLLGYPQKAYPFLHRGLYIARVIQHHEDIIDAYDALSKSFARQQRYDSAYYYHVLYTTIRDSVINNKVNQKINRLEVERRDGEIAMLTQRQKIQQIENEKQSQSRNFLIGLITLLSLIAILLVYIRSAKKQQKLTLEKQIAIQAERQRISRDMHDDLGTGLSTMLIYVNMMKLKLAGSNEQPDIERISGLGNELVGHMKEIVWSLNPVNDQLDSLLLFIRQYFVQTFELLPYRTHIIFPANIPDIVLKGEARHNIFLCVKEALTNVIKHSQANLVELNIYFKQDCLFIVIKDNGIGIQTNNGFETGNGLKNIRFRMEKAGGAFHIINNNGTTVQLQLDMGTYPKG